MHTERASLQRDMFTGELVDIRSDAQKRRERERSEPQQLALFKTAQTVAFGDRAPLLYREWLAQAAPPVLELAVQDNRTPAEVELDALRAMQKHIKPMFEPASPTEPTPLPDSPAEPTPLPDSPAEPTPEPLPVAGVIFSAPTHRKLGFRARLRAQAAGVRGRG